jgi:hypothetical protein
MPQDYETVVTQVHREGEDAVVVRTETGRTYRAAAAVLALSPSVCWCWGYLVSFMRTNVTVVAQLMQKFSFSPPLPPRRIQVCPPFPVCLSLSLCHVSPDQLQQRMVMGSVFKTFMIYARPWWRDLGYAGIVLCDGGPGTSPCRERAADYCLVAVAVESAHGWGPTGVAAQ